MSDNKRKILIIMGRYLPGYKDGGPLRSIKNMTDYLGDEYDFRILTCDRDHGDMEAYPDIRVNDWNQVGKAKVFYVPPKGFTYKIIKKLSSEADLIYVCGCFNDYARNTLLLKRFGKIKKPVVVAAMGLFSPLEFRLKYWKKKPFITIYNILGMFRKIYWSATSETEISEIRQQVWAKDDQFFIAEDLPRLVDTAPIHKEKKEGCLEVVWISRIAPKKNLLGAIEVLSRVKSKVHFVIYGPVHTEDYWNKCNEALKKLPPNISWEYKGLVDSEKVVQTLRPYHVFLFPTLGENYGHVIQEALSAGCACILSDQTPWNDLEENDVGFVYPLKQIDDYVKAVDHYAEMPEFDTIAEKAIHYIAGKSNQKVKNTGYTKIFEVGK